MTITGYTWPGADEWDDREDAESCERCTSNHARVIRLDGREVALCRSCYQQVRLYR